MSGIIAVTSLESHLSPINCLLFQAFWTSILLWLSRRLIKFSWVKSLCYSTGLASLASITVLAFAKDTKVNWGSILLCLLPVMTFATIIGARALVNYFLNIEVAGNVNVAERKRTLEMVDQGKITSEEGAELLEALGRSNAMLGQDKFSKLDMLILIGIAITLLGVFLPWIEYKNRTIPQYISRQLERKNNPFGLFIRETSHGVEKYYQSGYHTGTIGWAILIVGVLAAIPIFITPKNFLYKVSMLQIFLLLLGCALVISMLIRVGDDMAVGLPVCIIGLVLASTACFGKFKKLAA